MKSTRSSAGFKLNGPQEPEVVVRLEDVLDQAPPSIGTLLPEPDNELMNAVQDNDDEKLKAILARREVDVNCMNASGQTPLQIAVTNKSTKVIQILLQNDADVGNSLLQAVADESLECVKILLEFHEKRSSPEEARSSSRTSLQQEESANFENYHVTPLILAAKNNSYDIVKFLLSKGYVIDDTDLHNRACDCEDCESEGRLGCSLRRLNVYRGLSSPVYLSLSHLMKPRQSFNSDTIDPILQAFILNKKLLNLADVEYEFKGEYQSLSEQCEDYAVSLLNQCRNMSEIQQLMDVPMLEEMQYIKIKGSNEMARKLSVLNFAIKNNNKKFIAHSYSQMMLNSVVYRGLRSWESFGAVFQITIASLYTLLLPLWALMYIFCPQNILSQKLKTPILKFVGHSGSFCLFLVFLSLSSVQDILNLDPLRSSFLDFLLILWIAGITLEEAKEFFRQGKQRYLSQFWNIITLVMLLFFFIAGGLWIAGYAMSVTEEGSWAIYIKEALGVDNEQSQSYRLILISNSFFAVAFVLAFVHISNNFQVSSVMGPLQLSLVKMMRDILKFLILFALIYSAFTLALRKVYSQFVWAKRKYGNSTTSAHGFSSLYGSMRLTFWAVFDKTELSEFATDSSFPTKITQNTGEVLFALFNIATLLVAINMLIAMMSNSFQSIEDNSDIHWRFSRTRMWMQFIDKGSVLPPPFNIIPTVYDILRLVRFTKRQCQDCTQPRMDVSRAPTKNNNMQKRDHLINHLIQRHFYQLEKDRNTNVTTEPVSHGQYDTTFSTNRLRKFMTKLEEKTKQGKVLPEQQSDVEEILEDWRKYENKGWFEQDRRM